MGHFYSKDMITFLDYVNEALAKFQERVIESAVLITNNAPLHSHREIQDIIESTGHTFLFLAIYSQLLNLVENMSSQWKDKVKRGNPRWEEEFPCLNAENF
ncbi:hypothetical protein RF11_10127 [Thelohanellus kitauei]|uniref:Tc1-like transposase DDE domain-containing protein n=1 Tax=Thelohanellus kitauei TaxID=669202 RepID=A0A0C2MWP1_THEKT|nr:hypothetical protein RF11_10127 [Thelohanellus kitauei]